MKCLCCLLFSQDAQDLLASAPVGGAAGAAQAAGKVRRAPGHLVALFRRGCGGDLAAGRTAAAVTGFAPGPAAQEDLCSQTR